MQQALNKAHSVVFELGLTINLTKTEAIKFKAELWPTTRCVFLVDRCYVIIDPST